MAQGLPLVDVVNVTTTLSPTAAPTRNFGAALHVGVTDVIDTGERMRSYSTISAVGGDFGTTDPEYIAASYHFAQSPQPSILYIGKWAQSATAGRLKGGVLTAAQKLITAWTGITAGSMTLAVDGTTKTLSALNFSAATTLSGVAAIIDTALSGASVTWDANNGRFVIKSDTTGASSTVGYASATGLGTDISAQMKLTSSTASAPVAGVVAESLATAMQAFADKSGDWYAGLILPTVTTSVFSAAAAVIEAQSKKRIIGTTITDTTVLDSSATTDLASICSAAGYSRTFLLYSATPYAIASFFGLAATIDFTGSNTTKTMKFKVLPSITPEYLTETQAATLKSKRCNMYVYFDNGQAITQEGVMSASLYFDERQGLDWAENADQTALWNVLYGAKKIPQTDAGVTRLLAAVEGVCRQSVTNGLVAPGVWTADGFGKLNTGDYLTSGYYIYAQSVGEQSQADREARKSPPIMVARKLAGAIHSVNQYNYVNR